jgi:photosystem II stability/assembly factor-like uncharacterized protein
MDNEFDQIENPENVVYSLAVVEVEKPGLVMTTCFAATTNGLMVSEDGTKWEDAYASLKLPEPLTTTCVVVSPTYHSDHIVVCGVSGGVLRSEDGGKQWQTVLFPQPLPVISCLAISPSFQTDGIIFAGTMEDGVFFSSDEGAHWVSWNFGLLDLNILSLAASPSFNDDETIYAGTESGIFKSTNGGRAWKEISFPIGYVPIISLAVSPNFSRDHTIFAGTEENGMFRSQDAGKTWQQVGEEVISDPVNSILFSPSSSKSQYTVSVIGGKVLISRDNGSNWEDIELDDPNIEITNAAISGNNDLWIGTVGAKVLTIKIA